MSIITIELITKLKEAWLKLRTALHNTQLTPLTVIMRIHEFNSQKNDYFSLIGHPCTAENQREILECLSDLEPLGLDNIGLIRLEELNIGLTEYYNRQAKSGNEKFHGDNNILTREYIAIGSTIARIFSVNAQKSQIKSSEFPRQHQESDFKVAETLVTRLEHSYLQLINELDDLFQILKLHRQLDEENKLTNLLTTLIYNRISEVFNMIWCGANKDYFLYAIDHYPLVHRRLLRLHENFEKIYNGNLAQLAFQQSPEYKLRIAKHKMLELIDRKQSFFQTTENQTLLARTKPKVHTAKTMGEINQQLEEVKVKYKPRDTIFTLIYLIKRLFSMHTSVEETDTYQQAKLIQQQYLKPS